MILDSNRMVADGEGGSQADDEDAQHEDEGGEEDQEGYDGGTEEFEALRPTFSGDGTAAAMMLPAGLQ